MLSPRLVFAIVLACQLTTYGAYAMDCSIGGLLVSCPTVINDKDQVFCCSTGVSGVDKCCDVEEYLKENTGILVGILVALLIVIVVITMCCCCFCSCCCLAKRRIQRGTVLYGPITSDPRIIPPTSQTSFSPYPLVHSPPSVYPPQYELPANPNFNNAYPPAQPSYNP